LLRTISGIYGGYSEAEPSRKERKSIMDYAGTGREPAPEKKTHKLRN
jgi:hypothetical protein